MEEISKMRRPTEASFAAAKAWIVREGLPCKEMASSLFCRGTARAVGRVLGATFYELECPITGDRVHRIIGNVDFPAGIEKYVHFLSGLYPIAVQRTGILHHIDDEFVDADAQASQERIQALSRKQAHAEA